MAEATEHDMSIALSVVLPAYNEDKALGALIVEIRAALQRWPGIWEIVVVDDGSSDGTSCIASSHGVRLVRHIENRGYGGACKTGIRSARGCLVALMDADGGHDPVAIPQLLSYIPPYEQVSGQRIGETRSMWGLRIVAKWVIRKLAEWISGKRIPDLNCGMRVFRREIMLSYLWCLPEGFSASTSMTLAFLTAGLPIKFVRIAHRNRIGWSKFRPLPDTINYVSTVVRVIVYFRPLRVFGPLAVVIGGLAVVSSSYSMVASQTGLHDADVILAITAVQLLVIGFIMDLLVARHRSNN